MKTKEEQKLTVRKFMLKKFPTNKYMDCPVPKHHWETIQEYADEYAKQQAGEFQEWKWRNPYEVVSVVNNEFAWTNIESGDNEEYTTAQLYELFIQEQSNSSSSKS